MATSKPDIESEIYLLVPDTQKLVLPYKSIQVTNPGQLLSRFRPYFCLLETPGPHMQLTPPVVHAGSIQCTVPGRQAEVQR